MQEKNDTQEFTSILIPTILIKKIEKRIKSTEFSSISSYVTYILNEIINTESEDIEELSKEDDERIKARLRSLGYLD